MLSMGMLCNPMPPKIQNFLAPPDRCRLTSPSDPPRMRLVVATSNPGKIAEIAEILRDLNLDLHPLSDLGDLPSEVEEGGTAAENARRKAVAAAERTGLPALADDSALEIDALGGAPGIRSARFAGPAADDAGRNSLILAALAGVPEARRMARFRCAIAIAEPGGKVHILEGLCEGAIASSPRGAGGFGYDPIFVEGSTGQTFAEMDPAVKNRVSHRASALRKAGAVLRAMAGGRGATPGPGGLCGGS